ncbi:hypothetical protein QYF36_001546 [Acer negundo]|nr:hypothetical protein QYF36_001546 [Acer negundo]
MNDAKSRSAGLHGTEAAQLNGLDHVDVRDSTNSNQKASPPSSFLWTKTLEGVKIYPVIILERSTEKISWQLTLMIRVIRLPEARMLKTGEHVSSDVLISSPDEHPKHLRTNSKHGYDSVRSNDAFEANLEVEVDDKRSYSAEAKPEVDIKNESDSTSRSSNAENESLVTRANNSPMGESVSSDVISSPDEQPKQPGRTFENGYDRLRSSDAFGANSEVKVNDQSSQLVEAKPEVDIASHRPAGEQQKQLQTSFKHGYDRVRSNDTFETTSYSSPSSELSGTLDYMSKSPTIRSSHAYYDGSVSSFDGIDEQVPEKPVKSYKNPNKFVNYVASYFDVINDQVPEKHIKSYKNPNCSRYPERYIPGKELTGNSPHSCLCLSILIAEDFARSTPVTVVIVLTGLVPRVLSSLQTLSYRYATGKRTEDFARSTPVTVVIVLTGLVPRVLSSLQTLSYRYATGKRSLMIRGMKNFLLFKRRFHQIKCGSISKNPIPGSAPQKVNISCVSTSLQIKDMSAEVTVWLDASAKCKDVDWHVRR